MPDVEVLVKAHLKDAPDHTRYAEWLVDLATRSEPFALSESVLQGFLRRTTKGSAYPDRSSVDQAFAFIDQLLALPTCQLVHPGPQHWRIFRELCQHPGVRGKLVGDAVHAATAIENGCEWVTADTDFARFSPPLRWRHL